MSQYTNAIQEILGKLAALDAALQSLGGVHEDNKEKVEELHKTISTKKLTLMDELLKLISSVKIL